MTIAEIQNNAKTKMEKTKDVLRSDLMAIRAGRANPQLLDRITVDYYGTPTPLKNVANISALGIAQSILKKRVSQERRSDETRCRFFSRRQPYTYLCLRI